MNRRAGYPCFFRFTPILLLAIHSAASLGEDRVTTGVRIDFSNKDAKLLIMDVELEDAMKRILELQKYGTIRLAEDEDTRRKQKEVEKLRKLPVYINPQRDKTFFQRRNIPSANPFGSKKTESSRAQSIEEPQITKPPRPLRPNSQ